MLARKAKTDWWKTKRDRSTRTPVKEEPERAVRGIVLDKVNLCEGNFAAIFTDLTE